MSVRGIALGLAMLCVASSPFPSAEARGLDADLLVTNAFVYTLDPAKPVAEAVAVARGRIIFVGGTAAAARLVGAHTRVIDARGAVVMPGFIDAHTHPLFLAEAFGIGVATLEATSLAEFKEAIREFARQNPDLPVIRALPWRYDFLDGRLPGAAEVDETFADVPEVAGRPLLFQTEGGQEYLLNSRALTELRARNPIAFERARPERDGQGQVTGVLLEGPGFDVLDYFRRSEFPVDPLEGMLDTFVDVIGLFSAAGVTAVDDQGASSGRKPGGGPDRFGNIDVALEARRRGLLDNVRLTASLHVHELDFLDPANAADLQAELDDWQQRGAALSDEFFAFGRQIKLYVEGVAERHTAAMFEPYSDADEVGVAFWPTQGPDQDRSEEFYQAIALLDRRGLQVGVHATGDRGSAIVVNAVERLVHEHGPADRRFRIEHNELPRLLEEVSRLGRLDIYSVATPFVTVGTGTSDRALGFDRLDRYVPLRSMLDAGAPVAMSSDFTVSPLTPFAQMYQAVFRLRDPFPGNSADVPGLEQRISLAEAVSAYTVGSARSIFREGEIGSLEVGKLGDLVILNPELFALPPAAPASIDFSARIQALQGYDDPEIARIFNPVRMTIVNGRVVHANEPPLGITDQVGTPAGVPVTFDVLANDVDETAGFGLFVSRHTQPAHGAVVRNLDGTLTYTPPAGFVGLDRFTYHAHDGAWESDDVAVLVEVGPALDVTSDPAAS